jgi:benzoyl-CoA reductase/2-hydroxyglutaryl-CoA dehydratase subunit BcrC/BadD/HgdB
MLAALDESTWRDGRVTGRENFDWLVAASDFGGGLAAYEAGLKTFLDEARRRVPGHRGRVRLGLAGVPPINRGLFEFLEELGADVVLNEIPRQFALGGGGATLTEAYTSYTYPYGFAPRLADLRAEIDRRSIIGLVHYVQTFCHRGIQDLLLRKHAGVPVLTVEGERPGPLSAQQRLRLETFVETLAATRGI